MYDDSRLAPRDVSWHEEYERWLHHAIAGLVALQDHEAFEDAQDLGDYVETIHTLLTFAPRTRPDIQRRINEEMGMIA